MFFLQLYIHFTGTADQKIDTTSNRDIVTTNCTVVYMSQCLAWNKCKQDCQSMGASNFRFVNTSHLSNLSK